VHSAAAHPAVSADRVPVAVAPLSFAEASSFALRASEDRSEGGRVATEFVLSAATASVRFARASSTRAHSAGTQPAR
jgi:hypothetical protein